MPWLPALVSAALTVQLTCAAGALAGPWALEGAASPGPAAGAAPVEAPSGSGERAVPVPTAGPTGTAAPSGPVLLTAPDLWSGDVAASPLGLDRKGALQVPATAGALGWWAAGPLPGQDGAAVVVGHVDLDGRPGVFSRLARARVGTVVAVGRRTGPTVRYRVVSVDRYDKRRFPTDEVYGPSAGPELRLITCGGRFDASTGHYEDNVVVVAVRA